MFGRKINRGAVKMEHVGRVAVYFRIGGESLDPDVVTLILGITPTTSARRGDKRRIRNARETTHTGGTGACRPRA